MAEPHPRQADLRVGAARVLLVGTIQGLAGEARHVEAAWASLGRAPGAVALGVPPEDVANLKRMGREGVDAFMTQDLDTGSYEEQILPQLSRFGDIAMPPDDLLAAERLAREAKVELVALDLDDQAHADLYVQEISGWQMIRAQVRQKRLVAQAGGRAESAEELMLLWDKALTSMKGYGRVEAERERVMAGRIRDLAAQHAELLVVLPYARVPGVAALVRA